MWVLKNKVAEKLPRIQERAFVDGAYQGFDSTSVVLICVELFPLLSYDFVEITK
jgi:spore maturation protein SpmB